MDEVVSSQQSVVSGQLSKKNHGGRKQGALNTKISSSEGDLYCTSVIKHTILVWRDAECEEWNSNTLIQCEPGGTVTTRSPSTR